ncbi:MAG: hypothetical protein JO352_17225 [Chloroflexi bacterium]|nr:hypothetical protein [Chloroflexota bacterium]
MNQQLKQAQARVKELETAQAATAAAAPETTALTGTASGETPPPAAG